VNLAPHTYATIFSADSGCILRILGWRTVQQLPRRPLRGVGGLTHRTTTLHPRVPLLGQRRRVSVRADSAAVNRYLLGQQLAFEPDYACH